MFGYKDYYKEEFFNDPSQNKYDDLLDSGSHNKSSVHDF